MKAIDVTPKLNPICGKMANILWIVWLLLTSFENLKKYKKFITNWIKVTPWAAVFAFVNKFDKTREKPTMLIVYM